MLQGQIAGKYGPYFFHERKSQNVLGVNTNCDMQRMEIEE